MKVIAIGNNKGGVGKTFISKTLAEYADLIKHQKTLLVDLDPQCNLSRRFLDMGMTEDGSFLYRPPIHPDYTNEDDWDGMSDSSDIFTSGSVAIYPTLFEHIDIIPAHGQKLQEVEYIQKQDMRSMVIDKLVAFVHDDEITNDYDLCIIDTRPSMGALVQSAMYSATHLIIPTEFAAPSVEGLHGMLGLFNGISLSSHYGLEIAGIVGNRVKTNSSIHKAIQEKLTSDPIISPYLLDHHFNEWGDYQKSMLFGAPSIFNDRKSKACQQAMTVCDDILNRVLA